MKVEGRWQVREREKNCGLSLLAIREQPKWCVIYAMSVDGQEKTELREKVRMNCSQVGEERFLWSRLGSFLPSIASRVVPTLVL